MDRAAADLTGRLAAEQESDEPLEARRWPPGRVGPKPPLTLARVTLPGFDDRPVGISQRARRPAPLHRRLGLWDPAIQIGQERVRGGHLSRDDSGVQSPLAVLQDKGLFRLVEHRGQLEVSRELAVDGRGGTIEGDLRIR